MPRIGVILSGCGVYDGSEIHEAVATLLAIDRAGAQAQCLAPDIALDEIDHAAHNPTGAKRRVLAESARISRGDITDLTKVHGQDFDALILPGGFGAAKNLCDFATKGADCTVNPDVRRVLSEAHAAGKPIGFICIAPALCAAVFGKQLHPTITIGSDKATAGALETLGAKHQNAPADGIVIDETNRIVTTPAYMCAQRISEVFDGIEKLVEHVIEMASQPANR